MDFLKSACPSCVCACLTSTSLQLERPVKQILMNYGVLGCTLSLFYYGDFCEISLYPICQYHLGVSANFGGSDATAMSPVLRHLQYACEGSVSDWIRLFSRRTHHGLALLGVSCCGIGESDGYPNQTPHDCFCDSCDGNVQCLGYQACSHFVLQMMLRCEEFLLSDERDLSSQKSGFH